MAHRGAESAKVLLREGLSDDSRSAPMPTECSAELFKFAAVGSRSVVAGFDGGAITSDAGALLLGATDRAIRLVGRFAGCFVDRRRPEQVEHSVSTLVGQRIFGIALGYEDLNDHDELRHDPVMAMLAGKLEARRAELAAGGGENKPHPPRAGPGPGERPSQKAPHTTPPPRGLAAGGDHPGGRLRLCARRGDGVV